MRKQAENLAAQVNIENKKEMDEWDDFVLSHPNGTPFHLSSWIKTLYDTYRFRPLLFYERDEKGHISTVFPCFLVKSLINGNRIVSIPFSDYGGPLCNDDKIFKRLLEKIVGTYEKSVKYMEIRSELSHCQETTCYDYFKRHVLTLSKDYKKIWENINKRTIQYSIRRATKAEVAIREENTLKGLLEFYRLNQMTRTKHGMPAQPKKYFLNLYENMVLKNHASILIAQDEDKVIAAAVFFKCNETIIYKYNASDPEFIKGKNPNHLMTWTAIQKACENGYRYFDFGRTSPDNKGLMRYKEMWGAEKKCCHYHFHPQIMGLTSIQEDTRIYKLLTKMWRILPASLSEMISARLYRHMA